MKTIISDVVIAVSFLFIGAFLAAGYIGSLCDTYEIVSLIGQDYTCVRR